MNMTQFWVGYAAALATYFAIGLAVGVYLVATNLARFHGAGFQGRRILGHVGLIMLFWPGAILEIVTDR